jgi:hypothetical protein
MISSGLALVPSSGSRNSRAGPFIISSRNLSHYFQSVSSQYHEGGG